MGTFNPNRFLFGWIADGRVGDKLGGRRGCGETERRRLELRQLLGNDGMVVVDVNVFPVKRCSLVSDFALHHHA